MAASDSFRFKGDFSKGAGFFRNDSYFRFSICKILKERVKIIIEKRGDCYENSKVGIEKFYAV